MLNFLTALENSGISTYLRESGSIWAYPLVLTLHTAGLAVLVGTNWAVDLRLLGVGGSGPLGRLDGLFKAMWAGFWINFATGILLFMADATTKGTATVFMVKLALIVVAVIVARQTKSVLYPGGRQLTVAPASARALAVASFLLWAAAITAGRFMAYGSSAYGN